MSVSVVLVRLLLFVLTGLFFNFKNGYRNDWFF